MTDAAKRERDRRHDAKRNAEKPWRAWYRTKEWFRRRHAQLTAEPFCRMCAAQRKRVPATIADHEPPHRGDFNQFFNGPLQSLCKPHHDGAKQSMERNPRPVIGPDGWPVDPNVKRPKGG